MSDDHYITCEDCDAKFQVVFLNWYGKKPIEFCPFCGSDDLTFDEEEENEV